MFIISSIEKTRSQFSLGSGVRKLEKSLNYIQNQEDVLSFYLTQTISCVEAQVGVIHVLTQTEVYYDKLDNDDLRVNLPYGLIKEITKVSVYDKDNNETVLASTDYDVFDGYIAKLCFRNISNVYNSRTNNGLYIKYTCGFSDNFDEFPEDIQAKYIMLAGYFFTYRLNITDFPNIIKDVFGNCYA